MKIWNQRRENSVTNFEKMKQDVTDIIMAMDVETFYEFASDLETYSKGQELAGGNVLIKLPESLFVCKKCEKKYGCKSEEIDADLCKKLFIQHCNEEYKE